MLVISAALVEAMVAHARRDHPGAYAGTLDDAEDALEGQLWA
jgi:proteasome lid subunit RPN8/RPN11